MREVKSIGVLSKFENQQAFSNRKDELITHVGTVQPDERSMLASYLRRGAVILAIMEYTTDIIGGKFGTSGGSGIISDGVFYWRGDAANYVEHYGVAPDEEFIKWARDNNWEPPELSMDQIIEIDDFFTARDE
jgi:hypothetical protein